MLNRSVNVEATWTHSGPGGGTQRLHQKEIQMTFRPYYAYMHVKYNEDQPYSTIEKCYVDSPETWSENAKQALKEKGVSF